MWRHEKGGLLVKRQQLLPRKGRNRLHSPLLYFTLAQCKAQLLVEICTMHKYRKTNCAQIQIKIQGEIQLPRRQEGDVLYSETTILGTLPPQTTLASLIYHYSWFFAHRITNLLAYKLRVKVLFAQIQVKIGGEIQLACVEAARGLRFGGTSSDNTRHSLANNGTVITIGTEVVISVISIVILCEHYLSRLPNRWVPIVWSKTQTDQNGRKD